MSLDPPGAVPSLRGTHPQLAVSTPGVGPFLAEGGCAGAEADAEGAVSVFVDGRRMAFGLRPLGGRIANTLTSPGLVRREWIGAQGVVTETLEVAPALPLVCLQWEPGGGAMPEVALSLDDRAGAVGPPGPAGGDAVHVRVAPDGRLLAVAVAGAGGRLVDGGSRLTLRSESGTDRVTLLLAGGTEREVRTALAAAPHLSGHAVRAGRGPDGGLTLRTGVVEVDEGLEWARARLASAARRLASGPRDALEPAGALLHGLATLAAGDADAARALLAALEEGAAPRTLLAARLTAVTGDAGPAQAALAAIGSAPLTDDPMWRQALPALADALRHAAPEEALAALRRRASSFGTAPAPRQGEPAGGRALPMAGGRRLPMARPEGPATRPTGEVWPGAPLDSILDGDAPPFADDPDGGWASWRARLGAGLRSGPAGPGTWDPAGRAAVEAARLVLELAAGVLGLAPDAPVGRVRIAPRLPSHVRAFEARGIPSGDARLRLRYEGVGRTHRFRVEPEAGSVPPLLVLEPRVSGAVRGVRVDGSAATLEIRRAGSGWVVPVQLPVDGPRELEIELDAEGRRDG